VGHGWTCEPFGYNALGWDKVNYEIKAEDRQYFAEIKGKRDFWNKLPINTNLCYSNPKTREIIINDIVKYLKSNPAVDILHLWLADDFNNHCECENCQKMRPSDFYVQMLNELDEALTEAGLDTKIVFLVYFDLLWKPLRSKIINQDRFIIMFAPITRTYLESFETVKNPKEPCDYIRNNITVPKTDEEFVGLFNDWRKDFGGDSFNFDYYLMWQYVKDPSFIRTAKLISRDIKCYDRLTLDGLISCQVQRVFMPTSLPMYVMAKTLWNQNLSYEEIEEDYYKNAFGKNYTKALDYSHRLSELFDNNFIIPEIKKTQEAEKTFAQCVSYLKNILPELENIKEENPVCQYSWKLLTDYGYLTIDFAETILAAINDSRDKFTECYNKLTEKVYKYDNLYKECFDGWGFMNVLQGIFADFLPKDSE
ncbi:MAG: DUF4838 domain-containing protein, partial [Armatimonadetes bacterium]|nr:DUF4838 domain-containing protein [Candidatus Hippobium faecium]